MISDEAAIKVALSAFSVKVPVDYLVDVDEAHYKLRGVSSIFCLGSVLCESC
jgi:hypothetical protein